LTARNESNKLIKSIDNSKTIDREILGVYGGFESHHVNLP